MRIRSIKPEFWSSPDIAALSDSDRLLFIGLWSYVDDHGRGRDDIALIVAALYPHDMVANPLDTVAKVRDGLARLSEADLILRYTVASRTYFLVTGWSKHQRVDKPRRHASPHPKRRAPPLSRRTTPIAKPSRQFATLSRHLPTSSRLEQGNRGTGEQGNRGTVKRSATPICAPSKTPAPTSMPSATPWPRASSVAPDALHASLPPGARRPAS